MCAKFFTLFVVALSQIGCAGGFRVGGNNCGAGIGAYIGAVPDVIKSDRSYYPPLPTEPRPIPQPVLLDPVANQ